MHARLNSIFRLHFPCRRLLALFPRQDRRRRPRLRSLLGRRERRGSGSHFPRIPGPPVGAYRPRPSCLAFVVMRNLLAALGVFGVLQALAKLL